MYDNFGRILSRINYARGFRRANDLRSLDLRSPLIGPVIKLDGLITGVEVINRRCHERVIYAVHVDRPSPPMSVTGRLMANE